MHKALPRAQPCITADSGFHKNVSVQLPFHQHIGLACAAKCSRRAPGFFLAGRVVQRIAGYVPIQLGRLGADHIRLTHKNGYHDACFGRVLCRFHRQRRSRAGYRDPGRAESLRAGNQIGRGLRLAGREER